MPRTPRKRAARTAGPAEWSQVHPHAAGIDVGSASHYVAVPPDRDPQPVQCFGVFTGELYRLADWLQACGIQTVALESTGVYWLPLFQVLETRGFEVKLVDGRQLKRVPGRKSDVQDCQWIQQLHSVGLLAGAFRPDDQICVLRSYLRQRAMLVACASEHVQHLQKALLQMNLQLPLVLEDVTGATGLRIIRAMLAGERDPARLAALRHGRCKHSEATIAAALQGDWREEHLFALQQAVELLAVYQTKMVACDERIEAHLATFATRVDPEAGPPLPPSPARRRDRNDLSFDATEELYRLTGVNLTAIPGLQAHSVLKLLSETGLDMRPWPTAKHFGAWLRLKPTKEISGGKVLRRRPPPNASRAAAVFRVAAQSLHHAKSALGAFLRRKAAQRGMPKAITATAYKLARIFYTMLKEGTAYVERTQEAEEAAYRARVLKHLNRRARELGYSLVRRELTTVPAAAP